MKAFRKLNFKHSLKCFCSSPRVLADVIAHGASATTSTLRPLVMGERALPDLSNPEITLEKTDLSTPFQPPRLRSLETLFSSPSPCLHLPLLKSIFHPISVIFSSSQTENHRGRIVHFYSSSPSRTALLHKGPLLFFTLWLLQAPGHSLTREPSLVPNPPQPHTRAAPVLPASARPPSEASITRTPGSRRPARASSLQDSVLTPAAVLVPLCTPATATMRPLRLCPGGKTTICPSAP